MFCAHCHIPLKVDLNLYINEKYVEIRYFSSKQSIKDKFFGSLYFHKDCFEHMAGEETMLKLTIFKEGPFDA